VYRSRVRVGDRAQEGTFSTLAEAVTWAQRARDALIGGGLASRAPAPPLRDAAVSFLHRARDGLALTRSRQPYAMNTLAGYEIMLRVHVLPLLDGRSALPLGDLPADAVDARTLQAPVDGLVAQRSPETARMAAAAVSAVLRDLYLRGLVDAPPADRASSAREGPRSGAEHERGRPPARRCRGGRRAPGQEPDGAGGLRARGERRADLRGARPGVGAGGTDSRVEDSLHDGRPEQHQD
jgi:hypothetical protein